MASYDKMSECEQEHVHMRRVAFVAVVVSTVAVITSVITLPMAYSYVQGLQTHMMQEMDFCKSRSRDMWQQVSAIGDSIGSPTVRQRRAWLFGQWVDNSGYDAGPPPPNKPNDNYNPTPVVNAQATPILGQSCCTCHQGAAGPAGDAGPPGDDGLDGMPGEDGQPGQDGSVIPAADIGEPCVICPPGPPGPMGMMGAQGPQGPRGPPGEGGSDGKPGEKGMSGPHGPPGRPGMEGPKGPVGEPGKVVVTAGPPGAKGEKGPQGPVGMAGKAGRNGRNGRAGQRGEPGDAGEDGKEGSKGAPGEKGPAGQPGPDGSCNHCPPPRLPPGW